MQISQVVYDRGKEYNQMIFLLSKGKAITIDKKEVFFVGGIVFLDGLVNLVDEEE